MPTTTNILRLAARVNAAVNPPQFASWDGGAMSRKMAIPDPRILECTGVTSTEKTQILPKPHDRVFWQWISPRLDGDQTFASSDKVLIQINSFYELTHGPTGSEANTKVHMRIVDGALAQRGSSLIIFAGFGELPETSKALATFYNAALSATVNALDGDRIVIEAGASWASDGTGVPNDNDDHGPAHLFADDDGKATFTLADDTAKNINFKVDSFGCTGQINTGPSLIAGAGGISSPSCDNVMLGG